MVSSLAVENDTTMMVLFGRPGAGKSVVADAAINLLSAEEENLHCVGLDLDVCVPQWMRDNFARGKYPTLKEREEFAISACDYVDKKLLEESASNGDQKTVVIVSFSFVNTDLRDIFRSRFPNALWALVNTTEMEAGDRIKKREGHFYKGAPPQIDKEKMASEESLSSDNSEWKFAPVTFSHTVLPGHDPVEENARTVADTILMEIHR
jgi:gluconate kinase